MLFSKKTKTDAMPDAMLAALSKVQAIIWFDVTGNVLDANAHFLSAVGYSLEDLKGLSHTSLVDDTQDQGEAHDLWSRLTDGQGANGKFARRHKDGSSLIFEGCYAPVSGPDGSIEKVVFVAHDVTTRAPDPSDADHVVNALNRSQALIEFTLDGEILKANANFLKTVGYEASEVIGKHHRLFVEDTYASTPEYGTFWKDLASGIVKSGTFKRRGKSGEDIWLQATYSLVTGANDQPIKVIKVASDITERVKRQAQDTVEAKGAAVAMLEFMPDGKILSASDKFLSLSGYRLDDLKGRNLGTILEPEFEMSSAYKDLLGDLENGVSTEFDLPAKTPSGDTCWFHTEFDASDAGSNRIVATFFDVTYWKAEASAMSAAITKLSSGNLTERMPKTDVQDFQETRDAFNKMADNLQNLISEVTDLTVLMLEESDSIAQSSQALSTRCEQQAASVEETSTSMDEMSSSVRSNAQNAKDATEAATNASSFAQKGQQIVEDAITAMSKIEEGSSEVRKIIEVIDSIAFQTNLLALNAGVEAARAGDAGRGFAVVASEVRALAQRASDSARDINTLIESSGTQVKEGAALVNQTGDALKEIVDAVARVSTGIEGIFSASTEQSEGVQEINQAILDIDSSTQKTAAISEESTASAMLLVERTNGLKQLIEFFNVGKGSTKKPTVLPATPTKASGASTNVSPPKPAKASTSPASVGNLALQPEDDDEGWDEF